MQEFHQGTHEGVLKTVKRLRAVFYWFEMLPDTVNFIKQCDICQRYKSSNVQPAGLQSLWNSYRVAKKFGERFDFGCY